MDGLQKTIDTLFALPTSMDFALRTGLQPGRYPNHGDGWFALTMR